MARQEAQHLVIGDEAAAVGDVVAQKRQRGIAGEDQRAIDGLEKAVIGIVLRQSRQPRLAEELAPDLGMVGEEAADVDGERRLVRQHAGIGGAVERGDVIAGIGRAEAPADEAAPFLAEDLAGGHQPGLELCPIDAGRRPAVDDILEIGRIAQEHDLVEDRAELRQDAVDLGLVHAGRQGHERIALGGEMAAAGQREQPADPASEREADDGQGAPLMGREAVLEHLLEAHRDGELVGDETRPEGGGAGGAGTQRHGVAGLQPAAGDELGQRVALDIIGLGEKGQARQIGGLADRRRIDAVLGQEEPIGGHLGQHAAIETQHFLGRIAAGLGPGQEPIEGGLDKMAPALGGALRLAMIEQGASPGIERGQRQA